MVGQLKIREMRLKLKVGLTVRCVFSNPTEESWPSSSWLAEQLSNLPFCRFGSLSSVVLLPMTLSNLAIKNNLRLLDKLSLWLNISLLLRLWQLFLDLYCLRLLLLTIACFRSIKLDRSSPCKNLLDNWRFDHAIHLLQLTFKRLQLVWSLFLVECSFEKLNSIACGIECLEEGVSRNDFLDLLVNAPCTFIFICWLSLINYLWFGKALFVLKLDRKITILFEKSAWVAGYSDDIGTRWQRQSILCKGLDKRISPIKGNVASWHIYDIYGLLPLDFCSTRHHHKI